jgi:hypothetical protein
MLKPGMWLQNQEAGLQKWQLQKFSQMGGHSRQVHHNRDILTKNLMKALAKRKLTGLVRG